MVGESDEIKFFLEFDKLQGYRGLCTLYKSLIE